ncbi:hypothetical protein CMI47_03090 [Candidatus Pacearchaeota archaeon]|jgi:hypothetical protein|nr:hypothetical protein [Candidatus Pacearchaeota archaeon]|tara:strand:- start:1690 stop:1938 length:249 start_codon:yes stop_codon:yes gene_type:complete
MREPENCSISYCGFEMPRTFEEIQFELLGLDNLIKRAEERTSMLKQSSFLANLAINNESEDLKEFFVTEENKLNDKDNSIKE